ncbi:MAG: methionine gamma-lyase family protein [Peptococcaceae bacterium]|nr:methionine gamma-lyase family protein [Peptococcaceae bacterium]
MIAPEELLASVEADVQQLYRHIDGVALANQARVLQAFHEYRVSEYHLRGTTGYGYGDAGRETLDAVWARVFQAEAALVRIQIVSGTHALAVCLFGLCQPGDSIVALGHPYDTLDQVIGITEATPGSLRSLGVSYHQVPFRGNPGVDCRMLAQSVGPDTRVVLLQRSRGYDWRPSLDLKTMGTLIKAVKDVNPETVVLVDNCYGEFVETREPPAVGADLVCGSLIKNPGGGIAPTGGYIAGKEALIKRVAGRLTAPGIGGEVGPSLDVLRLLYQGLYLAPHFVSEALKGAVLAARFFERLGYEVLPRFDAPRTDIVQGIKLGSPQKIVAFCRGIQKSSPVDAHVIPEIGALPGYEDGVVMAAGTFIQGASLELTADAPIREPYAVYLQGGLSKEYVRLGILEAYREMETLTTKD